MIQTHAKRSPVKIIPTDFGLARQVGAVLRGAGAESADMVDAHAWLYTPPPWQGCGRHGRRQGHPAACAGCAICSDHHPPFPVISRSPAQDCPARRPAKQAKVEVTPAHTNRLAAVPGPVIRLGGRRSATLSCRDEVLAAIDDLAAREGLETFTVRQVAAEMLAAGSAYKKSAIAKPIQRMRGEDGCAATPDLERVDRTHFRLRR
jgi:hypothetical protein